MPSPLAGRRLLDATTTPAQIGADHVAAAVTSVRKALLINEGHSHYWALVGHGIRSIIGRTTQVVNSAARVEVSTDDRGVSWFDFG